MATVYSDSTGKSNPPAARIDTRNNAAVGELLRRARERRGLTLEQISNQTKISLRHLEALEQGNFSVVPSAFYRRAEIRAYARAVDLDQSLVLAEVDEPDAL